MHRNKIVRAFVALAIFICLVFNITAAGAESSGSSSLPTMVVTATKTDRDISETPASVTVISGETISLFNPRDLSDILREAAGVDFYRPSTTGYASVNLRGLGATQTAILIDGQPAGFVMSGWGGRDPIQMVDFQNVDRIEIVRGSGSALYGPGAMGGVINIITKKVAAEGSEVRASAGYDSLATYRAAISGEGSLDKFYYSLQAKYEKSDGYKPAPTPVLFPSGGGTILHDLQNEDWMKTTSGGRLGYMLSNASDIALTYHYLADKSNTFGRPNTTMDMKKNIVGLEYRNDLSKDDTLNVNFSMSDHHGIWAWDSYYYDPAGQYSNLDTAQTSASDEKAKKYTAEIRNQWEVSSNNTFLTGVAYNRDEIDVTSQSIGSSNPDSHRTGNVGNLGVYAQDEIRLLDRKLFVTISARYDTFDYRLQYKDWTTDPLTDKDMSKSFSAANPRASLRYNLDGSTAIKTSAGTGYRSPDTWGLVGGGVGTYWESRANSNLDSEKSTSYDLGVEKKFSFGLNASLTGYYIDVKDYIQTAIWQENGKFIYQSQNIGKVSTQGIELEMDQAFSEELSGSLSYTYNESRAKSDSPAGVMGLPENGKLLTYHPLHKGTAALTYKVGAKYKFRIDGVYTGEQYASGDTKNDDSYKLPSYLVSNAKLTCNLPIGGRKLDISAGVNNIFDTTYSTWIKDYRQEPRVVFVELGYVF